MRTLARLVLLTLVVVPVAYWILTSGIFPDSVIYSVDVVAQPAQIAQVNQRAPSFSHDLDCARASWYNAPIGDGKRMFVPSYSGFYDDSVAAWDDMTDPERGAFLAICGEVQP